MRIIFSIIVMFITTTLFAQLEISTGVAVNKQTAAGFPLHLGYEFPLFSRLYTKSAVGYKRLRYYNDYVGATLKVSTVELHQTLSYEVVRKKGYILKPNLGLNYRFYHWNGKVDPPYNTLPQRAWVIGVRNGRFVLNSFDNGQERHYRANNLGFSLQLQNRFRLNEKLWLHLTPFIEPDYDRSQNTGGLYAGIILTDL